MLSQPYVETVLRHYRVVCPDCFVVLDECLCGRAGLEKDTHWRLCEICMKREPELEKYAERIPEGTLLDARLVFRKIMPILNYPKEFIPARLHPGYDQWKERLVQDILLSTVNINKGKGHERRDKSADSGDKAADRGGDGGEQKASPSEDHE